MEISGGNERPYIIIGGRKFTDLTNLKTLYGYAAGGASKKCTFRTAVGDGYQVPVAKKFVVCAVEFTGSAANSFCQLGYSDNNVGLDSATAFTNPVYPGGNISAGALLAATTHTPYQYSFYFEVIASKYLGFTNPSTGDVYARVYGYEEDV